MHFITALGISFVLCGIYLNEISMFTIGCIFIASGLIINKLKKIEEKLEKITSKRGEQI